MGAPALVLDFGGPMLLTPFELVTGLPGTPEHELLFGRGPLATAAYPDQAWQDVQAGRLTERAYWDLRAADWHRAGGGTPDIRAMIAHLYEPPRPDLVRAEAWALVRDAKAAGHPLGILTNDMRAFHAHEWVDAMDIVAIADVLVDGSIEGHLKPDPRLYELLSERLGLDFADLVFLDDMRPNIRGAEALGIRSVWFDVADPGPAFAEIRELLGLPEEDRDG